MRLRKIGNNQTELRYDDGTVRLYSYYTLVALYVPGEGAYCTDAKYSPTTDRHISEAVERWKCERIDISQYDLEDKAP